MKWSLILLSGILFLSSPWEALASQNFNESRDHHLYRVTKVIDGDTIKLDNGQHVRLIGIDAPEVEDGPKLQRDLIQRHLTKSHELAMGKKSREYLRRLLEGKKVRLKLDTETHDDYHRLLAYVYLADGEFVNARIIKAGYAYSYSIKPDIRYKQLFEQLYKQAKEHHRGLWQNGGNHEKHIQWFSSR